MGRPLYQNQGSPITFEFYDGPLREASVVRFTDKDGAEDPDRRMIQVSGVLGWTEGTYPNETHHMRFTRVELAKMMAMLDNIPVEDFHGEMRLSVPEEK